MTNITFAQTLDPQTITLHSEKRKANLTAGWIFLGVGILTIGTGYAVDLNNNWQFFETNPKSYDNTGIVISYIGGGMTLGSIPFFISAHKHKKKAAQASLSIKNVQYPNQNLTQNYQKSISLSVSF